MARKIWRYCGRHSCIPRYQQSCATAYYISLKGKDVKITFGLSLHKFLLGIDLNNCVLNGKCYRSPSTLLYLLACSLRLDSTPPFPSTFMWKHSTSNIIKNTEPNARMTSANEQFVEQTEEFISSRFASPPASMAPRPQTGGPSSSKASASLVNVTEPPGEFVLLYKLPPELRMRVWNFAAHQPRLIEIEFGANTSRNDPNYLAIPEESRHYHRVTPQSRLLPAVLRACRESREEGLKNYSWINLDSQETPELEHAVYYSTNSDIVHFGDNSLNCNMRNLFSKQLDVPLLALNSWNDYDLGFKWNDDTPLRNFSSQYRSRIVEMHCLHGGGTSYPNTKLWNAGCKGLKEVFWLVDSSWCGKPRPEEPSLHSSISKFLEGRRYVYRDDDRGYRWAGEFDPKFHFVACRAPKAVNDRDEYTAMVNDESRGFFQLLEKK